MIGFVILAYKGWWWPGILVLTAISMLTQAAVSMYLKPGQDAERAAVAQRALDDERAGALPEHCPACGGPLTVASVTWLSSSTASCPYCRTAIKAARPQGPIQVVPQSAAPRPLPVAGQPSEQAALPQGKSAIGLPT